MIAYFDTSAFVKLVVPEPGSAHAIEVWDGATLVVSSLMLYPEARAAIGSASRAGRLNDADARSSRALLARLWGDVERIGVGEGLAHEAGRLAELHALRAYDAVHLASLAAAPDGAVLVSADAELLAAARARGYATIAPSA